MSPAQLRARCDPRWEHDERRSTEADCTYRPLARPGSLDDPDGPTGWDMR
ncbi:hypothetical protein [Nocardia sp. NPDC004711]